MARARRRVGDRVVAKRRQRAGAGVHQTDLAGRVGRIGEVAIAVELAVRPHCEVAEARVAAVRRLDRRLDAAPHGIDGLQAVTCRHEERDVTERERRDVRREAQRAGNVDQGSGGRGRDGGRLRLRASRVAREADVVLDHAVHRIDRLHPHERVAGGTLERGVELRRQLLVARHGHVIPQLLRRIGRGGGAARLAAGRAGRIASRELRRADHRIELAERAGGQIVGVGALAGTRLVGGDVRVAAGEDQLAGRVEHPQAQVAAEAVAVVEVDHRGPALQAATQAADDLNLLVVEGKRVPVDVCLAADVAGDADRVVVGLEQVAHVLGSAEGAVCVGSVFTILAGE